MQAPITISDAAAERVKTLLNSRNQASEGVRVGVKKGGCSGLEYVIEYADDVGQYDEVVEEKGVRVIIDPKAMMYLLGSEMDYREEKLRSGFVFENPNEKGKCGCGESFHV